MKLAATLLTIGQNLKKYCETITSGIKFEETLIKIHAVILLT